MRYLGAFGLSQEPAESLPLTKPRRHTWSPQAKLPLQERSRSIRGGRTFYHTHRNEWSRGRGRACDLSLGMNEAAGNRVLACKYPVGCAVKQRRINFSQRSSKEREGRARRRLWPPPTSDLAVRSRLKADQPFLRQTVLLPWSLRLHLTGPCKGGWGLNSIMCSPNLIYQQNHMESFTNNHFPRSPQPYWISYFRGWSLNDTEVSSSPQILWF